MRPTGCTAAGWEVSDERPDQAPQGAWPSARGSAREGSRWIVVHHRTVDTLGKMLRSGAITQDMYDAAKDFQAAFIVANLDPLRAIPILRVPGTGVSRSSTSVSSMPAGGCTSLWRRWAGCPVRRALASGMWLACSGAFASGRSGKLGWAERATGAGARNPDRGAGNAGWAFRVPGRTADLVKDTVRLWATAPDRRAQIGCGGNGADRERGAEVIPLVTFAGLLSWRVALERRQFVSALHPFDPFGDLNVRSRRNGVRIIIGRTLNIYDSRQHFRVGIEESGATLGAEMSPAMFRGHVNLGCALGHFDLALRVNRPTDHRRTGVAPTISAMAQRVGERRAFNLIADCAAMAAARNHSLLPCSVQVSRGIRSISSSFRRRHQLPLPVHIPMVRSRNPARRCRWSRTA